MYKLRYGASINYFGNDREQSCPISSLFFENLKQLEDLGFDTIDMNIMGAYRTETFHDYETKVVDGLEAIKESKLEFNGVHLNCGTSLSISSLDDDYRKEFLDKLVPVLQVIDKYNPYCILIHSSGEPIEDKERKAQMEQLVKSVEFISKYTKSVFCVENLPRTCLMNTADEVLEVNKMLNGKLNVCLDVNHFLKEPTEEAILKIGSLIKTTHISDHDYVDERHDLPGKQKINWNNVLGALEKVGYKGSFTSEVSMKKYGYTLEDVKSAFDKIFKDYNEQK